MVVIALAILLIYLAWQGKVIPAFSALFTGKVPSGSSSSASATSVTQAVNSEPSSSIPKSLQSATTGPYTIGLAPNGGTGLAPWVGQGGAK